MFRQQVLALKLVDIRFPEVSQTTVPMCRDVAHCGACVSGLTFTHEEILTPVERNSVTIWITSSRNILLEVERPAFPCQFRN